MRLGPDWHPVDTSGSEPFRWLTDEAIVYVQATERIEHRVSVELESGGEAQSPLLSILDAEHRLVAEAVVGARQTIQFLLSAGPPALHVVRSVRETT